METRILSLKIGLYSCYKDTLYAADLFVRTDNDADIVIDAWRKSVGVFNQMIKSLPGSCITEAIVYDHYIGRGKSNKKIDLMKKGE